VEKLVYASTVGQSPRAFKIEEVVRSLSKPFYYGALHKAESLHLCCLGRSLGGSPELTIIANVKRVKQCNDCSFAEIGS
jgi:hypothetical protein